MAPAGVGFRRSKHRSYKKSVFSLNRLIKELYSKATGAVAQSGERPSKAAPGSVQPY